MAKKFVRGVTGVDDIEKFDKSLTNVNDLLSDGKHNYIHRKKKDNSEEYHNLTNNLKTVSSDDTSLLEVTNDNDTDNSATFHPKHDTQKEQLLESERNTITINHAENATSGKTKVDVNTQKVLLHENLLTDYGISKTYSNDTTKLGIEYTRLNTPYDLNNLVNGCVRSDLFINSPYPDNWWFVKSKSEGNFAIQTATNLNGENTTYVRKKGWGVWEAWREQVGDKSVIDNLMSQKQNTLTNNTSIGVNGSGLQQLYSQKQSYSHTNGVLKTHVKSVSSNTSISTPEDEFNFTIKINKGATSASFTLNNNDQTKFTNIMSVYGQDNSVNISGLIFTLSGSSLTVTTANSVNNNYVITFSDII